MYRNMLITRGIEERGPHPLQAGEDPRLVLHGPRQRGRRRSASPPRWARTTSARRSSATWASTSRAASSRGASSPSTWGASTGRRKGRDGNVHMGDARLGLHTMVSHLPAMLPVAVGMALAFKIRDEKRVAVAWCGEGASARGDAHEGMNLAGVRRLPVVFVIDNNQWAYSTPAHLEYAIEHLADRAAAYGFEGVVVDGTDVLAVYREAKRAIEKAREGGGPTLIESVTLRMEGHAVHDDAFYVPKELFEEWAQRDPIERFRGWLRDDASMTDDEEDEITRRRQAPAERRNPTGRGVPCPIRRPCSTASSRRPRSSRPRTTSRRRMAEKTYLQAISDGLRQEMRRDQRVFVLGEDVGVYGGAFKVTPGLPGGVRREPRARHAALGDGDRGRRDRSSADGPAAGGRDAVRGLRLVRLGSPRHRRREAALPRRHADPDRAAAPVRRRLLGRAVPLAEPRVELRAHPGAQGRLPGDARGRQGAARDGDRGSEPRPLLRAQAPLPAHQGRGAGRPLHDAVRQGAHAPRRATTSP